MLWFSYWGLPKLYTESFPTIVPLVTYSLLGPTAWVSRGLVQHPGPLTALVLSDLWVGVVFQVWNMLPQDPLHGAAVLVVRSDYLCMNLSLIRRASHTMPKTPQHFRDTTGPLILISELLDYTRLTRPPMYVLLLSQVTRHHQYQDTCDILGNSQMVRVSLSRKVNSALETGYKRILLSIPSGWELFLISLYQQERNRMPFPHQWSHTLYLRPC